MVDARDAAGSNAALPDARTVIQSVSFSARPRIGWHRDGAT